MLRDQPDDIYEYGAAYFRAMENVSLQIRNKNRGRSLNMKEKERKAVVQARGTKTTKTLKQYMFSKYLVAKIPSK